METRAQYYKELVAATGMKQLALSNVLDINPVTLSRRLSGKYPITVESLFIVKFIALAEKKSEAVNTILLLRQRADNAPDLVAPKSMTPYDKAKKLDDASKAFIIIEDEQGNHIATIEDPEGQVHFPKHMKQSDYQGGIDTTPAPTNPDGSAIRRL